jgi:hypothetical protein
MNANLRRLRVRLPAVPPALGTVAARAGRLTQGMVPVMRSAATVALRVGTRGARRAPAPWVAAEAIWNVATFPAAALRVSVTDWMLRRNAIPITDARDFKLTGAGTSLHFEMPPTFAAACSVTLIPTGLLLGAGLLGVLPFVFLARVLDVSLDASRMAVTLLAATLVGRALPDRAEAFAFLEATTREAAGGNPFAVLTLPAAALFRLAALLPPYLAGPLFAALVFLGSSEAAGWLTR